MPLPNFLCVGTAKAGTTTLYNILKQHPEICLSKEKEIGFFSNERKWKKGLSFYQKYFEHCDNNKNAIGEICPAYIFSEEAPRRIYNMLGKDVKLIFVFRNPLDRAYSHYWMMVRKGYENLPFKEALEKEGERLSKKRKNRWIYGYIEYGKYATQLSNYLHFFTKENMFFIIFEEDFKNIVDRRKTIKALLKFLNVRDDVELNLDIKSNPARLPRNRFFAVINEIIYKEPFPRDFLKLLIKNQTIRVLLQNIIEKKITYPKLFEEEKMNILNKYFSEEVKRLETMIDRDLSIWGVIK